MERLYFCCPLTDNISQPTIFVSDESRNAHTLMKEVTRSTTHVLYMANDLRNAPPLGKESNDCLSVLLIDKFEAKTENSPGNGDYISIHHVFRNKVGVLSQTVSCSDLFPDHVLPHPSKYTISNSVDDMMVEIHLTY